MNIVQIFEDAAKQWPDRIAIIDRDGKEFSYFELHNLVLAQAIKFKKRGIAPGDRVMVFVPMSIELYISVLALFYIGASAVFLDEWVSKERMEICCKMAGCIGFVASLKVRTLALLSKELRKIKYWFGLPDLKLKNEQNAPVFHDANPEHTALITFTTGSTGIPKAANRTHAFLFAQFDALMPLTQPLPGFQIGPDMPMLPIVLLLNLGRGITSVIADFKASKPLLFDPLKIWDQIKKHEIVSLTTSPFYGEKLVSVKFENNNSLKRIILGGAPVFPDLIVKINNRLPQIETTIVYGSTEAEPVSHISGKALLEFHTIHSPENGLLVGQPDTAITIAIISLDYKIGEPMKPLILRGSIGEICVNGDHVLKNYLNNPEAEVQNKILENGKIWHRTGDAGYMDSEGRLFLVGRVKQIIKYDNKTYYPFLIEYFLKSIPGVIIGTLILRNEELIAAVQINQESDASIISPIILKFLPKATIKYLKEMPMDPRHHSKIDFEKLQMIL